MAAPGGPPSPQDKGSDSDPETLLLSSGPRDPDVEASELVAADVDLLAREIEATEETNRPHTRSSQPRELLQLSHSGRQTVAEPQRPPGGEAMSDPGGTGPRGSTLTMDKLRELQKWVNIPRSQSTRYSLRGSGRAKLTFLKI